MLVFGTFVLDLNPRAHAAPTYDQVNGTYTDDFVGTTGLPTRYHAGVDTTPDYVQLLRNTGSGFVAPFYTDGYVRTASIIPTSVVAWNTVSFNAVKPANTSVNIQITDTDGTLYSDDMLPGNSTGFTTSPVDISHLTPYMVAQTSIIANAKIGRIKIKINLATTDTNVTPTVDDLVVSWTTKQGDLTATTVETKDWPTAFVDQKITKHTTTSNPSGYSAFRWASEKTSGYGHTNNGFVYNGNYVTSGWFGPANKDYLRSYNINTGTLNWEIPFSARGYFTIGKDGTGYQSCMTQDIFTAIDLNTGTPKWSYNFSGGHGNDQVMIGADGTLYTVRSPMSGGQFVIYAFNPDGTVLWTKTITLEGGYNITPGTMALVGNMLYLGIGDQDADYVSSGLAKTYALNLSTQEITWSYQTGDVGWLGGLTVDSDGTIFVAGRNAGNNGKYNIYALNPDGTVKWVREYATITDFNYYNSFSLRSDGTLMTHFMNYDENWEHTTDTLQSINTSNGDLLTEKTITNGGLSFTDNNNFSYIMDIVNGATAHDWTASTGYYDKSLNNKWKVVWPFSDIYNEHYAKYSFGNGQNIGSSLIQDDRGWLYGSFGKLVLDNIIDYNSIFDEEFVQYFALAPWTLSVSGLSGEVKAGDQVTLTATTAMQQTNLLLGGDNQVQAVMGNGDKVVMTYSSTNANGDTVWTGAYTIPNNITAGEHTFSIEASQSYMQTDITTHFATASAESGNTGITASGTFEILGASYLPEVGANLNQIEYLLMQILTSYH